MLQRLDWVRQASPFFLIKHFGCGCIAKLLLNYRFAQLVLHFAGELGWNGDQTLHLYQNTLEVHDRNRKLVEKGFLRGKLWQP